jgi:hypothetical protein
VEGAKPGGGDTLTSSAGAVEGAKPGGGDKLASFSVAVESAKPGGGGGRVCSRSSTSCGMWNSLLFECVPPTLVGLPFFCICKEKKKIFFFVKKVKQNKREMRYIKAKYEGVKNKPKNGLCKTVTFTYLKNSRSSWTS